ncbi:unnamed protein product [Moneuplotes crassus]|uniref:Uncharacterized protein n=1 Tax=Euplotes crassus TaxID=5936 RepID=A0AAD1XFA5_EUPCR|nr:unnamed protein product [Moneuplotes crassus]
MLVCDCYQQVSHSSSMKAKDKDEGKTVLATKWKRLGKQDNKEENINFKKNLTIRKSIQTPEQAIQKGAAPSITHTFKKDTDLKDRCQPNFSNLAQKEEQECDVEDPSDYILPRESNKVNPKMKEHDSFHNSALYCQNCGEKKNSAILGCQCSKRKLFKHKIRKNSEFTPCNSCHLEKSLIPRVVVKRPRKYSKAESICRSLREMI